MGRPPSPAPVHAVTEVVRLARLGLAVLAPLGLARLAHRRLARLALAGFAAGSGSSRRMLRRPRQFDAAPPVGLAGRSPRRPPRRPRGDVVRVGALCRRVVVPPRCGKWRNEARIPRRPQRDQLQLEMKKCKAVSPPQGAETDSPRSNTNSSEAPRLTQIRRMRVVLVGRLRRAAEGKRFRINNGLIYHEKIPLTYLLLVRQHSNRSRITFRKSNANRPCARLRKRDGYQANFAAVNSSVQTDTIAKG